MVSFTAVYEHGTLRPLTPIDLTEGEEVDVTVARKKRRLSPEEFLALAASVYEGLTEEEIVEIEKEFKRPMSMFGGRDLGLSD